MENDRIVRLERSVPVLSLAGWVTLSAIAAIVAASVAWGFAGTVPTKVAGSCIFLNSAGMVDVTASAPGRLADVHVKQGDRVRVGQVIALIAQPDLEERIRRARARLGELENRLGHIASLSKRGLVLNDEVLEQRRQFLRQQHELAQSRVRIVADQHATVRQLLDQGLVTGRAVEDTGRELRAAEIGVKDIDRQIEDLERGRTEVVKRERDERAAAELELSEARRQLAALESERGRSTAVVSPFDGRVVEVKGARGMLVSMEAPLVSLERAAGESDAIEVVMYVAAASGKKILPGVEAQIVPATVKREERGYLLGTVRYVSDYPATPQSLLATLGNEELVRDLAGVSAPFEIRIDLAKDGAGYLWSRGSDKRPAMRPGTLCSGEVLVRKERPIGFVIPALRSETR